MTRRTLERTGNLLDRAGVRWSIGVALPIAMILLDPAVFQSHVSFGPAILGGVKAFCYVATGLALLTFVIWMMRPHQSALTGGIFAGAAIFATTLGFVLLPFSMMGILFFGVGLLGLSPFLMALVFARAAWTVLPREAPKRRRSALFLSGLLLVFGIPSSIQQTSSLVFEQSLMDIASDDALVSTRGVERLRRWSVLIDLERIVDEYVKETEPTRQARLGAAYQRLTGQDAAHRAAELAD